MEHTENQVLQVKPKANPPTVDKKKPKQEPQRPIVFIEKRYTTQGEDMEEWNFAVGRSYFF